MFTCTGQVTHGKLGTRFVTSPPAASRFKAGKRWMSALAQARNRKQNHVVGHGGFLLLLCLGEVGNAGLRKPAAAGCSMLLERRTMTKPAANGH